MPLVDWLVLTQMKLVIFNTRSSVNYRNSKFFSKVPNLQNGDQINITDLNENTVTYEVYRKYIVDPTDLSCLDPSNKKEITLITCTDDSKQRVIVKAKAI